MGWTSRGDHSKPFLLFEFFCGSPPSCLKVIGWWGGGGGGWVVVAYEILVSAQGPLVLGFWVFGFLGPRVWGQGLTIDSRRLLRIETRIGAVVSKLILHYL